jgi:hypothetical protein
MQWRRQQQMLILDLDNGLRLTVRPSGERARVVLLDSERRMIAACQMPAPAEALADAGPTRTLAASLEFILRSGEYGLAPQYGLWAKEANRDWGRDACASLRAA